MDLTAHADLVLPQDTDTATLVGRLFDPGCAGPCVVAVRGSRLVDLTEVEPTVADLLERPDAVEVARTAEGRSWSLDEVLTATLAGDRSVPYLLAPVDLQVLKAAGVTFVRSMLERVIEERAAGDPARAQEVRAKLADVVGGAISSVRPGSAEAERVKQVLIAEGLWSQYLEVGIGPDPEIFTKAQPLAAVGYGAHVGIPTFSQWNNPEPEVVLAVSSRGTIAGATLGNDVNLRDVEGRSALLLGKAKDNNASAALGPFVRLFDRGFTLDDVRATVVQLNVHGDDGFHLAADSSMRRISRDPEELVRAAIGEHHQYPDGLCLYLGTMFAPVQDRDGVGKGFTHRANDLVAIRGDRLGCLANVVQPLARCAPWVVGASALLRELAQRGLLDARHATPRG